MNWISKEDKLPEPHVDFIALNSDGKIFRSCMCYGMHHPFFTFPEGDKDASDTAPSWIDVTHWIPMPHLREVVGETLDEMAGSMTADILRARNPETWDILDTKREVFACGICGATIHIAQRDMHVDWHVRTHDTTPAHKL